MSALESKSEVAAQAIILLGKMGPAAKASVPSLIQILSTSGRGPDDQALKLFVLGALWRIDPKSKEVTSAIKEVAARDLEPAVRKLANEILEKIDAQ